MRPLSDRALAVGLLVAGLAGAAWAVEPVPPGLAQPPAAAQAPARAAAPSAPRPAARTAAQRPESKPTWTQLTPLQQQALAPLSATWRVLGEAHKRKWLALSENFQAMPPGEQARLHSRMTEWAALSPQQRTLARLNFAEAQKVDPSDKRAKWEAYQALPPEEKRKLAAGAAAAKPAPPPTAVAVQPQPKLARVPKAKKGEVPPKVAGAPATPVQGTTLVPQPPALPAAPVQP